MSDLAKSEKYLRLAVALYSQIGKYHFNLGYCLGMQKRYTEALAEMELAHKYDPENERISKILEEMRKSDKGD
jgi:tetratricopeptide (TPR) repeat protein